MGDHHLVTVPQGVVGDRIPWGGEGQGGGVCQWPLTRLVFALWKGIACMEPGTPKR